MGGFTELSKSEPSYVSVFPGNRAASSWGSKSQYHITGFPPSSLDLKFMGRSTHVCRPISQIPCLFPQHAPTPAFSKAKIWSINVLQCWFQKAFGWAHLHKWIKMSKVLRIRGKPGLASRSTRQPRESICSQTMQQTQTQLRGWQQVCLQDLPRSQMLLLPKLGIRAPGCHPTKRKNRNDIMWWDKTHPTSTFFITHWKKYGRYLWESTNVFGNIVHTLATTPFLPNGKYI